MTGADTTGSGADAGRPAAPGPGSPLPAPDLVLDCTDLRCPLPVIELARHLADVEVGRVLAVSTRDLAARVDVPAWCRMRGQEYVGEAATDDDVPLHLVRRLS